MQSNFSRSEIKVVEKTINKCWRFLTMRINKAGNLDLELIWCDAFDYAHFVIYKCEGGYKIRRRIYTDNPFGCGTYLNNNRPFATLQEAMKYFENYIVWRKDSFSAQLYLG